MGCLLSFSFVSHILPTPTVGAYRKMLNGYDNYYLKAHYGKICIDQSMRVARRTLVSNKETEGGIITILYRRL